jgi:site-specific recombinase XerD
VPNIHPHRLRHHFALTYLRNGGNVLVLQKCLGHATVATTSRYVAFVTDDLAREHERCSPVTSPLSRR